MSRCCVRLLDLVERHHSRLRAVAPFTADWPLAALLRAEPDTLLALCWERGWLRHASLLTQVRHTDLGAGLAAACLTTDSGETYRAESGAGCGMPHYRDSGETYRAESGTGCGMPHY